MARKKNQEITRRTVTAQRNSDAPNLRVQADLDSSRGHSAIGSAASDVFGRLGQVASRISADRTANKFNEDKTQGAKDRSVEDLAGTPSAAPESLAERSAGYRRGYFLTEAANRLHKTKMEVAAETAKLEPGEDIAPLLQERFTAMLEAPEFQDPEVMRQLQPSIQKAQEDIGAARQKTELAEVFERQSENFRTMARDGIVDGSLRTPEGVKNFRALLYTEPFAYLDRDEADDILSGQFAELFATGEIDPETAMAFLENPLSPGETPLIDREGWQDKFQAAIGAGAAVRQKQYEEKQAEYLSTIEYGLQQRAARGGLAESTIMAEADKAGMAGKDKLSFVRRWIDQNDAGLKHMQSEANRAKEHKETMGALTANNALALTDAKIAKALSTEWEKAALSNDQQALANIYTKSRSAGVLIPQVKDLFDRATSANLGQTYRVYENLVKLDPIYADRYLTESNAGLLVGFHENKTLFGMSDAENITALSSGMTKGKRSEVAARVASAATRYFKDRPEMPDGSARNPQLDRQMETTAVRIALLNPGASDSTNMAAAERMVLKDSIQVNGTWVPMGGARPGTAPAIDRFVRAAADDLVKTGTLAEGLKGGVYAAPLQGNANRFALMSGGYPVFNPKTNKAITFDPLEIASVDQEWGSSRREAEVRSGAAQPKRDKEQMLAGLTPHEASLGMEITPRGEQKRRVLTQREMMDGKTLDDIREVRPKSPALTNEDGTPFPEFMDFLNTHRTKKAQGN